MTHSSRIFRPFLAVAVVLMMVCVSLTAIFATTGTQAAFATLEKGDKWALQEEETFVLSLSSSNGLFDLGEDDDEILRNGTITDVCLNADLGVYVLFEVVQANDTAYVIKVIAAQNIDLAFDLEMNAQMVVPGSYIDDYESDSTYPAEFLNYSDAQTTWRTISADAEISIASLQTLLFTVEKSSMNVTSIDLDTATKVRGSLEAYNIPNTSDYYHNQTHNLDIVNLTYDDYILDLMLDLNLAGRITFEPGISFVGDSVAEGDHTYSEFYMNGTLDWSGIANITGLPDWLTDKIFTEEAAKYGITEFPIDLAKIYKPGNDRIGNGTATFNETGMFGAVNVANKTIDDPIYGAIQVNEFDIMGVGIGRYLYYPEEGKIVGAELRYAFSPGFALSIKLASAPVDDVEDAITEVSDYVTDYVRPGSIAGEVKDADGNPISGATVRLNSTVSTTTDANGNFVFNDVVPGTYTINVSKEGYHAFEQSVTLVADEDKVVSPLNLAGSAATNPETSGEFPLAWALVAVLAVVVVALLGFMFLQKKKVA